MLALDLFGAFVFILYTLKVRGEKYVIGIIKNGTIAFSGTNDEKDAFVESMKVNHTNLTSWAIFSGNRINRGVISAFVYYLIYLAWK